MQDEFRIQIRFTTAPHTCVGIYIGTDGKRKADLLQDDNVFLTVNIRSDLLNIGNEPDESTLWEIKSKHQAFLNLNKK